MSMIYSAIPTPLTTHGELDIASLERMYRKNLEDGLKGFFVCGNMGEWNQLSLEQKKLLTRESVAILDGRAELIAGITETGLDLTLRTMKELSQYQPDSYAIMLPPKPAFREPLHYLKTVLDAADRPVYYYHCPPVNGAVFGPNEFEAVLGHPNLKGIKNSSGDIGVRKELLRLKNKYDFVLFEGHEWGIDEALMLGCDGALCGLAAFAGKPMAAIASAVDSGDFTAARELQLLLLEIFHGVYGINTTTIHNGHKYALKLAGVFETEKTLIYDVSQLTDQRREEVAQCLDRYRKVLGFVTDGKRDLVATQG